jgi:hypothetical protein
VLAPPRRRTRKAHRIQWYEATIALVSQPSSGGQPVRFHVLDSRPRPSGVAGSFDRRERKLRSRASMIGPGHVPGTGVDALRARAVTSLALADGDALLKQHFGGFDPTSRNRSRSTSAVLGQQPMPPGCTSALSVSPPAGQDVHPLWAKIGLYHATGTTWSRVYDNRHWTSDVMARSSASPRPSCARVGSLSIAPPPSSP